MRKVIGILLVVILILGCTGCADAIVHDRNGAGSITYVYGSLYISEELSALEISRILDILDDKLEVPLTPDCGFSAAVSFCIGDYTYALAKDGCPLLYNCTTERCITLSEEERQELETLFTSRGSIFPCN